MRGEVEKEEAEMEEIVWGLNEIVNNHEVIRNILEPLYSNADVSAKLLTSSILFIIMLLSCLYKYEKLSNDVCPKSSYNVSITEHSPDFLVQ